MGNCISDNKFFYKLNKKEQEYILSKTGKYVNCIPMSDIYNEKANISAGYICDNIYIIRDNESTGYNQCYLIINSFPNEVPNGLFKNFQVSGDIFISQDTIVKLNEKKMIVKNSNGTFKGLVCGIDSIDDYI